MTSALPRPHDQAEPCLVGLWVPSSEDKAGRWCGVDRVPVPIPHECATGGRVDMQQGALMGNWAASLRSQGPQTLRTQEGRRDLVPE